MSPRSKNPELPENVVLLRPDVVMRRAVGRPRRPRRVDPTDPNRLSVVAPAPERVPLSPAMEAVLSSTLLSRPMKRARLRQMAAASRGDAGPHRQSAPELPAEPVELVEAEGYKWPGSQPDKWEYGFRGFVTVAQRHPYLSLYPDGAFTRDVFLAWIAGNIVARARLILRLRYPGFDEPDGDPDYQNPPEALADPVHRWIDVLAQPQDQAMRRIRGDKEQYALWRDTLNRFPEVATLPQDWEHVFRGLGQRD